MDRTQPQAQTRLGAPLAQDELDSEMVTAPRSDRLARERQAYQLAGSEICRQLKLENKARALLAATIRMDCI